MWYSQTIDNAEENLTYISNSFIDDTDSWERFVRDFGNLYYPDYATRWGSKKIKRIDKFVTENHCYVRAMSLGTSPRWKNYTAPDGKYRPDLLIFDDVDTVNSTDSKKKIDKNYEFLLNEVLGGTTSATQIIFLGNTIYEDWLVPRFRDHIQNDKNREIIRIPIYDEEGKIVRDRFVETDEEAEELNEGIYDSNKKITSLESERRRLGTISFNQNYLLIPYVKWQHVITRDMIKFDRNCRSYDFDRIYIGVDPAVSEKEGSDYFAITVVGQLQDKHYVLECIALEQTDKNIKKASVTVKELYNKRNATACIVETVAYQAVLKTVFSTLGMAVIEEKGKTDKVSLLMEKQYLFEDWKVYFAPGLEDLVEELVAFPNVEHDDRVDSMRMALHISNNDFFITSF